MPAKPFTDEQVKILIENPNTEYVNTFIIRFTAECRANFIEGLKAGKHVRILFQEAGYDYDMLGKSRASTFASRMRKEAKLGRKPTAGYKERKRHPDLSDYKDMAPEEAMSHMQNEILYLHQELEFIKKIIELDNVGGQNK